MAFLLIIGMSWFSGIERAEAVQITEVLLAAGLEVKRALCASAGREVDHSRITHLSCGEVPARPVILG
jgi:hypothetical protein